MTKIIMNYNDGVFPPKLTVFVHGPPHKRQHDEVKKRYSRDMRDAAIEHNVPFIAWSVDLDITWVNPTSPDQDHLLEAFYAACDKNIMKDDRLFNEVRMRPLVSPRTKRDGPHQAGR